MGPRPGLPRAPHQRSEPRGLGGRTTAPSITREADSRGLAVTVLIRPLMCEVGQGLGAEQEGAKPSLWAHVGPMWGQTPAKQPLSPAHEAPWEGGQAGLLPSPCILWEGVGSREGQPTLHVPAPAPAGLGACREGLYTGKAPFVDRASGRIPHFENPPLRRDSGPRSPAPAGSGVFRQSPGEPPGADRRPHRAAPGCRRVTG